MHKTKGDEMRMKRIKENMYRVPLPVRSLVLKTPLVRFHA